LISREVPRVALVKFFGFIFRTLPVLIGVTNLLKNVYTSNKRAMIKAYEAIYPSVRLRKSY